MDRLRAIVREPQVAPWWVDPENDEGLLAGKTDDTAFAIELAGEVIGWVGYGEEPDPGYRHAWIDIVLTTPHHGHGLGAETLRTVIAHLIEERGHHRITIDPAAANARAIRCYESVGFRPVGVMRRYERDADGEWRDGLLMELVIEA